MAFNINQFGQSLAQHPLPRGWSYTYLNDGFVGPAGEFIGRTDVENHGSFHKAYAYKYGSAAAAPGATGSRGFPTGGLDATGANGPAGPYSLSIADNSIRPASALSFETDYGRVTLNIKTGDLTLPVGMSRENSIREFWMGFQKHFDCGDATEYKRKIADLSHDVQVLKDRAITAEMEALKISTKKVAEKVAKKYAGEKFIMIKPEDLIKFIQDA